MASRRMMVNRFDNLSDTFSLNRIFSGAWVLGVGRLLEFFLGMLIGSFLRME